MKQQTKTNQQTNKDIDKQLLDSKHKYMQQPFQMTSHVKQIEGTNMH